MSGRVNSIKNSFMRMFYRINVCPDKKTLDKAKLTLIITVILIIIVNIFTPLQLYMPVYVYILLVSLLCFIPIIVLVYIQYVLCGYITIDCIRIRNLKINLDDITMIILNLEKGIVEIWFKDGKRLEFVTSLLARSGVIDVLKRCFEARGIQFIVV